ncbi:response regulator [Seohaeicola saemankumensis]|nr:response regulator [Seohaeicola saemankumensis]MCA0873913.1 response regulator [Seohaeicola saemankumensis]
MAEDSGHLLIVEDNKVNRLLLTRNVELLGHRVSVAENGKVALEMLTSDTYDLLLLDIEMPEMDGFEVLEALKADAALRDLPVIVTSSVEGLDNIVRCIELGAEDYLPKPINKVLLKARVSSGLEKKRLRDEQKELLRRFATSEVAQDLEESGFAIGGQLVYASVLFCDIRGFSELSEGRNPETVIELLNSYYTLAFEAISSHGGIVTLMIGDGLMAVFGAPRPLENPAQSAVFAAQDMLAMMAEFNQDQAAGAEPVIKLGVGIATGEMIAGYAGTDKRATYTCVGKTVNLAARLEEHTKLTGFDVLIDKETSTRLPDDTPVQSLLQARFKGFSDPVDIFALGT